MFTALFKLASSWKQPKCPSTVKWINNLWLIYTKEYYKAIKKNELMVCNIMDESQNVMLNERNQTQKSSY